MAYLRFTTVLATILLAACGQKQQVQRLDFDNLKGTAAFGITPSPNIIGAMWTIAPDGKGIRFGLDADKPYLSLTCKLAKNTPPALAIVRHAQSEPGAKALFAVIGNGVVSRMNLDAELSAGGWQWGAVYPADAPQFDAFTGPRDIEATLPGAGMVQMAGSALPREFIEWCRQGGGARISASVEQAVDKAPPPPPPVNSRQPD